MRLHLLALELLYAFKGSGRQHRVELLKEDDAAAEGSNSGSRADLIALLC